MSGDHREPGLSIAKVLEHYGADLARVSEHGWRALKCPFHDDRQASASANLEKGAFVCHACGVKGDAISLIKEREGLDYIGACQWAEGVLGASGPGVSRAARHKSPPRKRSRWRDRLSL